MMGDDFDPIFTKKEVLVTHIHKKEGPEYNDSIEIGAPSKGGSIKIYLNIGDPVDAERRIKEGMRLRKLALSLYQEVQS